MLMAWKNNTQTRFTVMALYLDLDIVMGQYYSREMYLVLIMVVM